MSTCWLGMMSRAVAALRGTTAPPRTPRSSVSRAGSRRRGWVEARSPVEARPPVVDGEVASVVRRGVCRVAGEDRWLHRSMGCHRRAKRAFCKRIAHIAVAAVAARLCGRNAGLLEGGASRKQLQCDGPGAVSSADAEAMDGAVDRERRMPATARPARSAGRRAGVGTGALVVRLFGRRLLEQLRARGRRLREHAKAAAAPGGAVLAGAGGVLFSVREPRASASGRRRQRVRGGSHQLRGTARPAVRDAQARQRARRVRARQVTRAARSGPTSFCSDGAANPAVLRGAKAPNTSAPTMKASTAPPSWIVEPRVAAGQRRTRRPWGVRMCATSCAGDPGAAWEISTWRSAPIDARSLR